MTNPILIISNPPQTQPDFRAAAPLFGLSAAEVRMKANYGVPEIWFADNEETRVLAVAESLQEAGFRISLQNGKDVADVPKQTSVKSFSFAESSLVFDLGNTELTLPYDSSCFAVLCQPRDESSGESRASSANALRNSVSLASQWERSGERQSMHDLMFGQAADTQFLDIYSDQNGTLSRVSLFDDVVDFQDLPKRMPGDPSYLATFTTVFTERFPQAQLDKRLVGMRLRRRPTVSGVQAQDDDPRRRLYSFATTALKKLLESISEDLADLGEPELSSRLAFLTGQ